MNQLFTEMQILVHMSKRVSLNNCVPQYDRKKKFAHNLDVTVMRIMNRYKEDKQYKYRGVVYI